MEAQWETEKNAPFHLLLVPDEANETNSIQALSLPGIMSWVAYGDVNAEIKGLKDFPKEDRPPVAATFWSFRVMLALGGLFALLALLAVAVRNSDAKPSCLLKALVWSIPLPYVAIMLGWAVAEIGRQPWIVYNLMRTSDAVSPVPDRKSVV